MTKPFSTKELVQKVRELLAGRGDACCAPADPAQGAGGPLPRLAWCSWLRRAGGRIGAAGCWCWGSATA
jgi:DNA-binding response OmpR family regulator